MTFKEKINKGRRALAEHCVEATSLVTVCNPIYAFFELALKVPQEISIHSKYTGSLMGYLGLSKIYVAGANLWRKAFGITEHTPLETRAKHNRLYTAAFNAGFSTIFYPCNGEHDISKVVGMAVISAVFGYSLGDLSLSAVDTGHELMGFKKSDRTPRCFKNVGSNAKKGLAALLVAGSILSMNAIYNTNAFWSELNKREIVQNSYINK
jgi:hypothetical protein